jgi:hypothetical protein
MEKFPNGPPTPKDMKRLSKQDLADLMELMGGLPDEFFEDY